MLFYTLPTAHTKSAEVRVIPIFHIFFASTNLMAATLISLAASSGLRL